jgi:L,D-transpeptidase YcbB
MERAEPFWPQVDQGEEVKKHYRYHPQYQKLKALYEYYQSQRSLSTPPHIVSSELKAGSKNVAALTQRLIQFRYLEPRSSHSLPEVVKSLKLFQTAHGLSDSGKLDEKTRKALNGSLEDMLDKVEFALEEWKEMKDFYPSHVIVNIPSFELYLFCGPNMKLKMPVILGKKESPTPIFNGEITEIVTHPTWYIPPGYVARLSHNVGSRGYAWEKGRLIQRAGPHNPLGAIKFVVKGGDSIILHSTNKPNLFNKKKRMDSSGCVRVKDCLSLAKILLNEEKKKQEVDHLVAQKKTRYMTLPTPFPLHILYATVWVDEGGVPHFFPDVYDYQEES